MNVNLPFTILLYMFLCADTEFLLWCQPTAGTEIDEHFRGDLSWLQRYEGVLFTHLFPDLCEL